MNLARDPNIVLRLGSRSIECGFEGSSKPIGIFNVYHFAERQNFSIFQEEANNITDHSDSIGQNPDINLSEIDLKLQNVISDDLLNFQYLFYPDLLVYDNYEIFQNDLKIHLRKLFTKIFYKSGMKTINSKLILLNNSTFPDFYIKIISDILIHKFLFRSVIVLSTPLMASISAGSAAGIVIDIGWSFTSINAVFDNRVLTNLSCFTNRAGAMIHYTILSSLESNGFDISKVSFRHIENSISEIESINNGDDKTIVCGPYFINSKLIVDIIKNVCFKTSDKDNNDDYELSLIQLVVELIEKKLPIDLRKILSNKIIITGGLSNLIGFNELLIENLKGFLQKNPKNSNNINFIYNNVNNIKTLQPWVGASIYSNTMKKLKKTNDLWEIKKQL